MRIALSVIASAFVLAGCADVHNKFAETTTCKRPATVKHAIAQSVFFPGVVLGGDVLPARDVGSSGKLDTDWGSPPSCIRRERDERKPTKLYDLHRIGMVL